jgi:LPS-assembly protein
MARSSYRSRVLAFRFFWGGYAVLTASFAAAEEQVLVPGLRDLPTSSDLPPWVVSVTAEEEAVRAPITPHTPPSLKGSAAKRKEDEPSFIIADRIEGQTDESTRATGNVELQKDKTALFADQVTYRPLEDEVEAEGQVRLTQEGAEVSGPYLKLQLSTQIGHLEDATYKISRMMEYEGSRDDTPGLAVPLPALPPRQSTAYGKAIRIHFEGENQFRIENGSYSTCRLEDHDWYAKSSEIKLDYDQNQGEARDAVVYFKDVPFIYTPYLSFSLNNQRKSGFLSPSFASSTRTGFDLSLPYYWNIAPNYDATFTPRVMTKRGLQLGTEVRYLDHYANSAFQVEYMPRDKLFDDRRYAYALKHSQTLGKGFSAYVDWNGVSDDEYFTDLSSRVVQTSRRQLPRQFVLEYGQQWWSAKLQTLRYQTLNPGDEVAVSHPYFLEPQLSLNARTPEWKGLEWQMQGQYTRFTHVDKEEGERMVLYPQFSFTRIGPGYYIKPKVGLHSTQYRLSGRADGLDRTLRRNLPIFSLDAGMTFERNIQLAGSGWIQTLEPRLYYLNIPYRDQSQYPLFDTSLADFNFAQIFSENRFSGYDRIANANQVTAALTTRLIDPETGAERIRAMVGQRYYFTDLKVGLPGETLQRDKYSDFLVAVSGQVAPKAYVDMALEHDFNSRKTSRFSIGARYQPNYGQVLSIAYRYNKGSVANFRDTLDQIDIAGQWNLSKRWYAVGRYNYSFDSSRLVEGVAGLEYNGGCWVGRLVVQRLESTADSPNTSFFFQIELNDFGKIGSNPIQTLRRSVPGYHKINELPSGGLLTDE